MRQHTNRSKDQQSQSVNTPITQKKSKGTAPFVDNRAKAVTQLQLQETANNSPQVQKAAQLQKTADTHSTPSIQKKENKTGLPDNLKSGVESLSGMSMDDVKVHRNSSKPAQMQAHAYAQGTDIHLASGQEKHLAHEAWHVAQQKQGRVKPTTQAQNGVQVNDNKGLEKEADVMGAKAMGKGQDSNQELVQKKSKAGVVQRARVDEETHYGKFYVDDAKYKVNGNELDAEINFEPGANIDATKIGLTQNYTSVKNGTPDSIDANTADRTTSNNYAIDRLSDKNTPIYGADNLGTTDLKDTKVDNNHSTDPVSLDPSNNNATYKLGHHYKKKPTDPTFEKKDAGLLDQPTVYAAKNSKVEFETAALALDGKQKGEYYGSIKWGWERDGSGTLKKIDFDVVSKGVPSKNFMESAELWNKATVRGTVVVKNDGTKVYSMRLAELFTLSKDDEVEQMSTLGSSTTNYTWVKVTKSATPSNVGKEGAIEVDKLKDKGDGNDTVNLPLVKILLPTEANVPLYKGKDKTQKDKDLPENTRMRKISEDSGMVEVEIVDGPDTSKKGWIEKTKLKDE